MLTRLIDGSERTLVEELALAIAGVIALLLAFFLCSHRTNQFSVMAGRTHLHAFTADDGQIENDEDDSDHSLIFMSLDHAVQSFFIWGWIVELGAGAWIARAIAPRLRRVSVIRQVSS